MPDSWNSLRQLPGKPLWSAALMSWLAVGPAQAENLSWAFDVARAHIAKNYAWPGSDYALRISRQDPDRVVVYVRHNDDDELEKLSSQGFIRAGGGKSFEISLSRKTHGILLETYFQYAGYLPASPMPPSGLTRGSIQPTARADPA